VSTATLGYHSAGRTRGGYGFRTVARMEWRKMRTVRSTWALVAVFAAAMISLAVLGLSHENYTQLSAAGRASFDPASDAFLGLVTSGLVSPARRR
jgi:ABC-2 type transport system permease protein